MRGSNSSLSTSTGADGQNMLANPIDKQQNYEATNWNENTQDTQQTTLNT